MNHYYEMYIKQTKELVVDPLKKISKQFSIIKVKKRKKERKTII